jgi:signal transduction histidine kinase
MWHFLIHPISQGFNMPSFFQQVFDLLTTSPGNLAYHIILAFSVVGALQVVISHWRSSGFPQGRRTSIGLTLLLLAQLLLFASTILAWQNLLDAHRYLPPLDRAVSLFSLVIIIWIWAFPETSRLADAATFLLVLLVGTGTVLSVIWWVTNSQGIDFNNTWADSIVGVLGMILSAGGILLLMIRRPNGWGIGAGMLSLIAGGYTLHWLVPGSGDYSGVFRLAQITAFPLLLTLPQRFPISDQRFSSLDAASRAASASQPLIRTKPRYSTDPKVMQAFLELVGENSPDKACRQVTRMISQLMLADLCLLVSLQDEGPLVISCGYDLIRESAIEGFTLETRLSPVISSALKRGRPLRLPASSTSPDIQSLSQALNMARIGHLLVVPFLPAAETTSSMGIILLSPYSNRSWTQEDQTNLLSLTSSIGRILQHTQQVNNYTNELEQVQQTLETTQLRLEHLDVDNEKLRSELAYSQEQMSFTSARAESLAVMLANQEAIQAGESTDQHQAQLEVENRQLKTTLTPGTALTTGADGLSFVGSSTSPAAHERLNLLTSITQDLRQPLSSIVGYTDLLLGESIGILGAMQRKFLERIKSSVERVNGLVEDIANMTARERLALAPVSVNLSQVIDEAIAQCAPNLRDKNIALRVNLPDQLPEMRADHDALHQILLHLLENAGVATPIDGDISLSVRIEAQEHEPGYALLQVADTGSGISPGDLPRVFSRLYRGDNPNIQGVGDNGAGLSVVKTLVEAHGGRIWVDSEPGHGATYSVLLPLGTDKDHGGRM